MVLTEKKNTWVKSCKESAKTETEIFKMAEIVADDAKVEDGRQQQAQENLKATPKKEVKKKKLVPFWENCKRTWMRPTLDPLKQSKSCAGSSRSTCTRGTEDLEDHRTSVTNSGK